MLYKVTEVAPVRQDKPTLEQHALIFKLVLQGVRRYKRYLQFLRHKLLGVRQPHWQMHRL